MLMKLAKSLLYLTLKLHHANGLANQKTIFLIKKLKFWKYRYILAIYKYQDHSQLIQDQKRNL